MYTLPYKMKMQLNFDTIVDQTIHSWKNRYMWHNKHYPFQTIRKCDYNNIILNTIGTSPQLRE